MAEKPIIAAIIPAAGLSSRFDGANKLVQPLGVFSIVQHVVQAAKSTGCHSIIVVTGYEAQSVRQALRDEPVQVVHNEMFEAGMGASISAGVKEAGDVDGYLIWPADMPLIKPSSAAAVIDEFDPAAIVVPICDGKRGHPVLFPATFRVPLEGLTHQNGARSILNANADSIKEIEIADSGIHCDIDNREDLDRVIQKLYSNL